MLPKVLGEDQTWKTNLVYIGEIRQHFSLESILDEVGPLFSPLLAKVSICTLAHVSICLYLYIKFFLTLDIVISDTLW